MRTRLIAAGVLLPILVVTACSGTSNSRVNGSAMTRMTDQAPGPSVAGTGSGSGTGTTSGTAGTAGTPQSGQFDEQANVTSVLPGKVNDSALTGRDLILHAELTVRVKKVDAAVAEAERLTSIRRGLVAAEKLATDPAHPEDDTASLTLRVPTTAYDSLLSALAKLGTRVSGTRSVDDVSDQVVDTASRISTASAGIGRVRTLLNRANTLGQVISLESELTRRQSDLESLQRRLASLRKQVALATIEVQLATSTKALEQAKRNDDRSGFLGGLRSGWDAFTSAGSAVLTAVGAALPFALLVAALIAAAVVMRRRRIAPSEDHG
ncbi:MAG: hypothetical protein QOG53_812 [Frankiales bacterium]|jgi:hypothetical protein|nr:hypothetical protein [Frankiales bacterium]